LSEMHLKNPLAIGVVTMAYKQLATVFLEAIFKLIEKNGGSISLVDLRSQAQRWVLELQSTGVAEEELEEARQMAMMAIDQYFEGIVINDKKIFNDRPN